MKKSGLMLVVLILAMGMIFVACTKKTSEVKAEKIVVGGLIRNLNETFLKNYADNLSKLGSEAGVEIKILDANQDMATQFNQLNTLLAQGVKYFVVIPVDGAATAQMAKTIQSKGGAAAFSNTPPTAEALKIGKNFFYASSPESVAGDIQADFLVKYFEKNPSTAAGKVANILYLNGELGHPAQVYRRKGFVEGMERRGWKLNFVAEDTAVWGAPLAQQKMDAWLAAFSGKFNAVIAQNDDMALGAIESMKNNKYTKADSNDGTILKVPVIGVDRTDIGYDSIEKKEMYATVLQDAIGQSSTAFELIYQVASKGTAIGYTTKAGLKAATAVTGEPPITDAAILAQCFLVPFAPVIK